MDWLPVVAIAFAVIVAIYFFIQGYREYFRHKNGNNS